MYIIHETCFLVEKKIKWKGIYYNENILFYQLQHKNPVDYWVLDQKFYQVFYR